MNQAYITLLSNDAYLPGVLALKRGLKESGSRFPLVCVVSRDVSRNCMDKLTSEDVRCLRLEHGILNKDLNSDVNFTHWDYTFDKLLIWELVQFDKLVYVDSDILVLGNLDSLFDRKPFSGVCAGKSLPGHETWKGINSGLVVIKPDMAVAHELRSLASKVIEIKKAAGESVGDQDVLQAYLGGWDEDDSLQLDEGYNMFAENVGYYVDNLGYALDGDKGKKIYCVHFIGRTKPWMKKSFLSRVWFIRMCVTDRCYRICYRTYNRLFR